MIQFHVFLNQIEAKKQLQLHEKYNAPITSTRVKTKTQDSDTNHKSF